MLFLSLLAFLPNLILGFSFAHLLWNDARISSIFLKGFLGIPLGMGISSILLFFWKLAGLSHSGYIVFELVFVTLVFVAMLLDQKKIIGGVKFDIGTNSFKTNIMLLISLCLSICISMANFLFTVFLHPHGREDAWSNWNLIARFIYYSDNMSNAFAYIHL
jgi:hypothetical protein